MVIYKSPIKNTAGRNHMFYAELIDSNNDKITCNFYNKTCDHY